jgi:uncharacterized protein (UPF0147 family)
MSHTEEKQPQSKLEVENAERLKKALADLQQVVESSITPKNIRKVLKDAMNSLSDARISVGVRAASAISILEELTQDPNMPSFSRVTMWSALSNLESIREQV